jgi:hypothetical protein
LQEQINDKTVALSIKAAKITGRLLAQAMQAFLKKAREPTFKAGRQSVKSLTKQGASISNIEVSGDNIGDFKRIARKYNVDFALKRDNAETPPKWLVFFKAKDADALTAAFKEYSKIKLKVKEKTKPDKSREKPNFLAKIEKLKQKARELASPTKQRTRGDIEL